MSLFKQEIIEEINDILDSLSPQWCNKALTKLSLVELLDLRNAIEDKIKDIKLNSSNAEKLTLPDD